MIRLPLCRRESALADAVFFAKRTQSSWVRYHAALRTTSGLEGIEFENGGGPGLRLRKPAKPKR
jgi:hypothetical protein